MPTRSWHCRHAWLGGDDVASDVLVESDDGVIRSVTVGVEAPSSAITLPGVVLPGLADAHSHAFHRALRTRTERAGSFWSWRDAMYAIADVLGPDGLYALATAAFAELACAGVTTVGEFHYLHHQPGGRPYDDPNETGRAILGAAEAAGIRCTLLDAFYLESEPGVAAQGAQLRFCDPSADAWAERTAALPAASPLARSGAAVHSLRAVPPHAAGTVARVAAARSWPLHAHVSEQPRENDCVLAAYGVTPTVLLERCGALGPSTTAVHATHLTVEDRAALGRAGATVCVCPTTERELGDGLVELSSLAEAGVAVCVGTDSHAIVDPFEELRCLEGHERLRTLRRGTFGATARLAAATSVGHAALGWPKAGVIAPGSPCDLVAVRTDTVRIAGCDDLVAALASAASACDVDTVVVHGEVVVSGGRHVRIDVPAALGSAIDAAWARVA